MLYVVASSSATKGINPNANYSVWDSDDLSIEIHRGSDIIKAYKGGIKFGNLSKVSEKSLPVSMKDSFILYANRRNCDMRKWFAGGVLERKDLYCISDESKSYNSLDIAHRMAVIYNGRLFNTTLYHIFRQTSMPYVPAIQVVDGSKQLYLIDMQRDMVVPLSYVTSITVQRFKRLVLLKGFDTAMDILEDS